MGENSPPPLFREKLAQTKKIIKEVFEAKKQSNPPPPSKASGNAAVGGGSKHNKVVDPYLSPKSHKCVY